MKYFPLIWTTLFARKTRTVLTVLSIAAAFVLFGMLDAVSMSFSEAGTSVNGVTRLETVSRLSFFQALPEWLGAQIARVPGVSSVAYANWFGGTYQDPHNQVFTFAVSNNYVDLYPEVQISRAARKAFNATRIGVLVGRDLMDKYHWSVGEQIPLQSNIYVQRNGSKTWNVVVAGVMHSRSRSTEWFNNLILMHWTYFNAAEPFNHGMVSWFISRIASSTQADKESRAMDAISANSDHQTRTMTESAVMANWMRQLGNIRLIVTSIMGATFFTLLLLTGNVMMQAVQERSAELGTLKTIGFSNATIVAMVLAESTLLLLIGGILGVSSAAVLIPYVDAHSGGMLSLASMGMDNWTTGLGVMLAIGLTVGVVPAWLAMRLKIVDAVAAS